MANNASQTQTEAGTDRPGALGPLPPNGRRVFIADLHLDGSDSPAALTFRALLKGLADNVAETPTHLYILGDLFDFWEEIHPQVAAIYETDLKALEEAHQAGVQIILLDGNRDFDYGKYVKNRFNATLMGDGGHVRLSDQRWMWIEHGDLLCTADKRYLKYRKKVRSGWFRFFYRLLPWSIAQKLKSGISSRSERDKAKKSKREFGIDLDAVKHRMDVKQCQVLMCGHTHKPQATDIGAGLRLLVLPPWCDICSGYRDRNGSLVPVHFDLDGVPQAAGADGRPRGE